MAPKKKKDEESKPKNAAGFDEVEKALIQLEIKELNRKLARLRSSIKDYEIQNEELQIAFYKLDEDRADIITYLKKTLNQKTEENTELKDRVKGLEELREEETLQFKRTVTELETNFTTMKAQLSSENKLLAGKVNTLEEFRAIREDLMKKFEQQEEAFADQQMKYKRIIYDAEKKFVIGKDKLKREMEGRLLSLAQDFQDASESRIAASTHRVIRENIALNNQLDSLLYTQSKVAEQNEKYKEDEREARNAMEVAEAERDKAINKSIVQLKVIDKLTIAFQNLQKEQALHDKKVFDVEILQEKVRKLTKENENMTLQVRILEQNLHSHIGDQNKNVVQTAKILRERDYYKQIIKDTISVINANLKIDEWALLEPAREILERKEILKQILNVLGRHRQAVQAESVESLVSFTDIYEKGDLGFVPKPTPGLVRKSRTSVSTTQSPIASEPKRSATDITTKAASFISLQTMPSIEVMAPVEKTKTISIESIPSFTVTSLHSSRTSTVSVSKESSSETEVAKQLARSKLEIQKSILRDLAFSEAGFKSSLMIAEESSKVKLDGESEAKSAEELADKTETIAGTGVETVKQGTEEHVPVEEKPIKEDVKDEAEVETEAKAE